MLDKDSNGQKAFSGVAVLHEPQNSSDIHLAFSAFLRIEVADESLIRRYLGSLVQDPQHFAEQFYDYLLSFPATAEVLDRYQASGGNIADLMKKQTGHFYGLLAGHFDEDSAQELQRIGAMHHRWGIGPVWMMGGYLLYMNHLQRLVSSSPDIPDTDRPRVIDSVAKLLFRDMGLMLHGYWNVSFEALKQEKNKVAELQDQIGSLLANIPQLLWSVDVQSDRLIYVSPSARQICDMDECMPMPCFDWTVSEDREGVSEAWQKALQGQKAEVESRVDLPGGEQRWFRRVFCPVVNEEGCVVRIDGVMEDTTAAKLMIERLQALATTDSLTGLPNRALFNDRLRQAILAATRRGGEEVVLMLMDLDHFKEINDTLGHPTGDKVLIMVAERLRAALRHTDSLARLGGDEFAVLLLNAHDGRKAAERTVGKVLKCFGSPFRCGDNELYLAASIGIVIHPEHGEDVATLMSRADVAMYDAKNRDVPYVYYDSALDPNTQQRLQLSGELRQALPRDELVLYYQPSINLRKGSVTSAEALVRWQHPKQGLLAPAQFLPIAERTGLIRPLTYWMIESAARRCKEWETHGYGLRVAVNIPGLIFHDAGFVGRLIELLEGIGLAPNRLELEITENVLMSDIEHVRAVLAQLDQMGVHISIDDFGTGYSSLAYLKKLPLHTLKIDKSFVLDMVKDENDAVIVRSIVDLGHNFSCDVVAEGVENQETQQLLAALGCDGAQGFHICSPLPPEDFLEWLKRFSHA